MNLSEKSEQYLKQYEDLRLLPYDDQTGKTIDEWNINATVGYGWLIKKKDWPKFKDGITRDQAETMFDSQVKSKSGNVNKVVEVALNQNQFDACVILSYNIGNHGFAGSSALKFINDINFEHKLYMNLEQAWKAWNKQKVDGKKEVNRGLVNRRAKEWSLYNG